MRKTMIIMGGVLMTLSIVTVFVSTSGQQSNSQFDKSIVQQPLSAGIINLSAESSKDYDEQAPAQQAYLGGITNTADPFGDTSGDIQYVEAKVEPFAYPEITVEVNKPVRINFKVDAENLNVCNNEIFIPEWNIRKQLSAGDNFVEFTPTKTGTFNYSCWMGMLYSDITVIEQGSGDIGALQLPESAYIPSGCGMMSTFGGMGGGCCTTR